MASVFGAFLLIMITGGCIAYFGDRLGYVMGKRRVTLFGLRPRHTAQALTVLSGIIIGGLALTLLLVVNYTFRVALLNGRDLLITNHNLKQSNHRLSLQVATNLAFAQEAEVAANSAQLKTQTAMATLRASELNLTVEQQRAASIQQQLVQKQSDLGKLSMQLADERRRLTTVQEEVVLANNSLQTAQQINEQDVRFRKSSALVYRKEEELGRVVISASGSLPDIRAELIRFLDRMSRSANEMGATNGQNKRSIVLASIRLFDQKDVNSNAPNTQALIQENESLDGLANAISTYGHGTVVVIANAIGNSYQGEQVIIVLRPFANMLAIPSGTILGQTEIDDSSASVDQIVTQLQKFLITQIRPKAISYGVIPVNDPRTGSIELGDVSLDQIYDVVHKIRDLNGPVSISVSAAQDTYSADKLFLNFQVKPIDGQ